jgi:hypothetical protein
LPYQKAKEGNNDCNDGPDAAWVGRGYAKAVNEPELVNLGHTLRKRPASQFFVRAYPLMRVVVAIASKNARIAWALLSRNEVLRPA